LAALGGLQRQEGFVADVVNRWVVAVKLEHAVEETCAVQ